MRQIDAVSRCRFQPLVAHSPDDTDNRVPGLVVLRRPEAYALAYRAFIRPVLARQTLVDDGDLRAVLGVGISEVAALKEGNAHCAEVTRRNHIVLDEWCLSNGKDREALDRQAAAPVVAIQRQCRDSAGGFNTGQRAQALHQLPVIIDAPRLFGVFDARQIDPHRHDACGIHSRIDLLQSEEAAHHQARANQQHQRQGDFRDDHQAARTLAACAGGAAATLLEGFVEVGSRRLQRRQNAKAQTR